MTPDFCAHCIAPGPARFVKCVGAHLCDKCRAFALESRRRTGKILLLTVRGLSGFPSVCSSRPQPPTLDDYDKE